MKPEVYDAAYFARMRGHGAQPDALHRIFVARLRSALSAVAPSRAIAGASILDVGCGRGELMALLFELGAGSVRGIDFSPDAVEQARQAIDAKGGRPGWVTQRSATDIEAASEDSFDLVLMTDVVEHLPQDDLLQALRNARTWLKPGGYLFIHTFPTLGPHRGYQLFLKLTRQQASLDSLNTIHCNVQTRRTLERTLETAGFRVAQLWLENDFSATSSAFQALPEGVGKRSIRFFVDSVMGSGLARSVSEWLRFAEFTSPSIYCLAAPEST